MSKPIIGSNNKLARIELPLPVTAEGDWAFDENGEPVKGREPLVLVVPRFDCIPQDKFEELDAALKELDKKKLSVRDKSRELVLATLRPFVTAEDLDVVGKLQLFELDQIAQRIQSESNITVGELLASRNS